VAFSTHDILICVWLDVKIVDYNFTVYISFREFGTSCGKSERKEQVHIAITQTQATNTGERKYAELGRYDLKLSLCSDNNALLCFEI
jgi:hypothetical protein